MNDERDNQKNRAAGDMAEKPLPFVFAWGAPIAAIFFLDRLSGIVTVEILVLILASCLAWMGAACLINARRCRRRHCVYSGPILLIGAALTLLVGFKVVVFGSDGLNYVLWGTSALVALTFVPEFFLGKYVPAARDEP